MQLREVVGIDDLGDLLEVVASQVEVLELLEVGEILVEGGKSVCADGQTLQVLQLADVFARVEVQLEGVDVAVELQLLGARQVLHLEGKPLLGREHEEACILDASLQGVDVSVHALLPESDLGPVVHLLARAFPVGGPDGKRAGDAEQRHGVTLAGAALDLLGGVLTDGQVVVLREHVARYAAVGGRDERDFGRALHGYRVDAPGETDGNLPGAQPAVEVHVEAVGLDPVCHLVGNLHLEVHVGLDAYVEMPLVERGVVFNRDFGFVERDGVVEALLLDLHLLVFGAVVGFGDTHDAAAHLVGERRVDDQPTLLAAFSVGGRDGDPGHGRRGYPAVVRRNPDAFGAAYGLDGEGLVVDAEGVVLVVRASGQGGCGENR